MSSVIIADQSKGSGRRRAKPMKREQAQAAVIDRESLSRRLDALRKQHSDTAILRTMALEEFRTALTLGRAKTRQILEADGQGLACAANICHLEDELIRAIYEFVTTALYANANPSSGEKMAIVAVGGYGRGTLAPGSDIDLLFLLPYKVTAWSESVIEAILYMLWDLGQKVGHSTRTVEECISQAREDMTIRTALLEARLIHGEQPLFETLQAQFDKQVVRKTAREFVAAKLSERDQRIARAGSSRYLVEPNVKEGKGGLRDLHTLFWIARYVYRVETPAELVDAGLFTKEELRTFRQCEEFLWRVRCHLHFEAGKPEERLTFDYQRIIAERLGYIGHAGLSDVERFMKHYFLVAKDVGDLTAIVCAELEESQTKSRASLDRLVGRLRPRKKLGHPDFTVEFDRITFASDDIFDRDPVNLIRLFWLADRNELPVHPDAVQLARRSLKKITAAVRNDPEANSLFLDILTSRKSPETVLRNMNETGVLGRFIPDFGRIVAMMQFNMYHHYTVDEHTIRCIGILSRIEAGKLKEDHPLSTELMPGISSRKVLYVALFLHDIAKGREEDHSIAGAAVARKLCPRLGLSKAETETVAWLVLHHLDMPNIAQGRDLSDPGTIGTFAQLVQDRDRLRLMLILSVCDIRGVGPGVWNGWKAQLLRTLYWETELVLSGGYSAANREQRIARAREELRHALPNWSDPEFDAYAGRHYAPYWLKTDLRHKVQHANLLRLTEVEMRSLATEVTTSAGSGATEITIVAPDHPRLLSIIANACSAAGANIVDAQVYTTTDGLALDTISVEREFDRDEDELRRGERVADMVKKALRGEIKLFEVVAEKAKPVKQREQAFDIEPEVRIDNDLSNKYTVIEVSGLDRTGLLSDLTTALARLNLNIGSAHIVTFGEKAVDAFYVTDLTGQKVSGATRHATIRKQLASVFQPAGRQSRGARAKA